MKTAVNNYQFHRAFEEMNRKDNFTYDGLNALDTISGNIKL